MQYKKIYCLVSLKNYICIRKKNIFELGGEYLGQLSDLRSLCINMDRLRDCPTE